MRPLSGKTKEGPRNHVKKPSQLEERMAGILAEAGIPFTREYKAIPGRKFPWDFAIGADPEQTRLLVEVQGGTWSRQRSGHSTGAGIARDAEKLNLATKAGWKCLLFTSDMIRDQKDTIVEIIKEIIGETE